MDYMYHGIPLVYDLDWDDETGAILILVHNEFDEYMRIKIPERVALYSEKTDGYKRQLGEFHCTDTRLGFDQAMQRVKSVDGYTVYRVKLPQFDRDAGYDSIKKALSRISHTLELVFTFGSILIYNHIPEVGDGAKNAEPEISSVSNQLIIPKITTTDSDLHGMPISSELTTELIPWVRSLKERVIEPVETALEQAYCSMSGERSDIKQYFRAHLLETKLISLACPGMACSLNPEEITSGDNGYSMSSHNVDSHSQQLTLLAGLSAINGLGRDYLGGTRVSRL